MKPIKTANPQRPALPSSRFRDSLKAVLHFEKPPEIVQHELGYWWETVERWKTEGMPPDQQPWEAGGITYYDRVPVRERLFPPFAPQVLAERDGRRIVRTGEGVVREEALGHTALPRFIKHPVECLRDFEVFRERLDPDTPGRFPPDWDRVVHELRNRDFILVAGRIEISFFGWHRDLMGLENLLLAYYDQPELVHAISRQKVEFTKVLYSRIMQDVQYDYVFFWEDMSYKNGPLISPALFREFMLPYYKELTAFFKSFGDYKILVDSDGDVNKLIPLMIEGGVDGMMPFECAAGMDIRKVAQEYPDFIIVGGIDKREIAKGRAAIDRELEAKLPVLFKRGGYVPTMDHHVPPDVGWEDFLYYLRRTQEIYKRQGV